MKLYKTVVASITGAFFFLLAGLVLSMAVSSPASATVQFAKDTNMACGVCHVAPAGGGALTPFGVKFQANGNKLPS